MEQKSIQKGVFDLSSDIVIAARDLYKIYKEGEMETVALGGVSLDIKEGEMIAVVGPSGSGKSTLLGILGGMIQPTSGIVYWSAYGDDISKLNPEEVIKIRRRFIGFVFQESNLIPHLTALQNVELSGQIVGIPDVREKAKQLLERVGLSKRMRSIPAMLSMGERQRVAIASALINNPKLVLADEPTGNLDPTTSERILGLFKELNEEIGVGFFIVTHSQQVASIADRTLEIRDGVLVGLHGKNIDMKDLDRTRILSLDDRSRLTIPAYLLDQLGKPRQFRIEIKEGRIVLTPIDGKNVKVTKKPPQPRD